MKVFSGSSNKALAEEVCRYLDMPLAPVEIFVFPDGERRVRLEESVVDEDVVLFQSTSTPVDHNYMELFFLIDSAKRSGAKSITVVMPYFGYQRQDHVFRTGEAVSLDVVIKIFESQGVDKLITFDLHTIKIPQLFHIPMVHLSALPLFAYVVEKAHWTSSDTTLASPDMGGLRRVDEISKLLASMPHVVTVKNRDLDTGRIEMSGMQGDVDHLKKRAVIIDDMISSGKTIVRSAEMLKEHGVEEIYVFATHPIFSVDAPFLLQKSPITKVFVTDSVYIPQEKHFEKLEIISLASDIAKVLKSN